MKPLHRAVAEFLGAAKPAARGGSAPAPAAPSAEANPQFMQDLAAFGIPVDPRLLTQA